MIKHILFFSFILFETFKCAVPPDKSEIDEDLIRLLAPKILSIKKPINLLQSQVSFNCQRDFSQYLNALSKMELWALKSK